MDYDKSKVDEAVLALLFLTSSNAGTVTRAWKGLSTEVLGRLWEKGYIRDPGTRSPTVEFTEEGATRSRELFFRWFGRGA